MAKSKETNMKGMEFLQQLQKLLKNNPDAYVKSIEINNPIGTKSRVQGIYIVNGRITIETT